MYGQVIFCLFLVGFSMMAGSWHTSPGRRAALRLGSPRRRSAAGGRAPGVRKSCPGYDRPVPRSLAAGWLGWSDVSLTLSIVLFSTFPLWPSSAPGCPSGCEGGGMEQIQRKTAPGAGLEGRRTGRQVDTCCGGGCTCPAR